MSALPPQFPPSQPPRRGPSPLVLGIVGGLLFLAAMVALNVLLGPTVAWGLLLWVPFAAYFVAAVVVTGLPRTTLFGAGLLIAFGISLLVGAGVCFALVAGIGRMA